MKVYLVGCVLDYLGSKVHQIACFEKELKSEPKFNYQYYDKMGNTQKSFYYFRTQEEADKNFFNMFRNLKDNNGRRNFPDDWKDVYLEVYERAEANYPYIIV